MKETWRARMRRLIRERGLNMKKLSLGIGQNESFLRDVIVRGRDPNITSFVAVAEALGVSIEHLWYGRDA